MKNAAKAENRPATESTPFFAQNADIDPSLASLFASGVSRKLPVSDNIY
jgi:hypothetical protein